MTQSYVMNEFNDIKKKGFNLKKFNINHLILLLLPLIISGHNSYLDIMLIVFYTGIILTLPVEKSMIIYVALFPWERMFPLPILSLHSIMQIIIILKIMFGGTTYYLSKKSIILLLFSFLYGILSFVIYGSFNGVGLAVSIIISVFIIDNYKINDFSNFWDAILKATIISMLIACFYGLIFQKFGVRWVDGLGYVPLFRGILESNEMAFYLNIALLFTILAKLKIKQKIIIFAVFYIFLIMTVSITGILVSIITIIYTYFTGLLFIHNKKNLFFKKSIIIFMIFVAFIIILQSNLGQPIILRFENILNNINSDQFDKAFSNRNSLAESYLDSYNSFNIADKLFGIKLFAREYLMLGGMNIQYAHNSFIEVLFYFGGVGLLMFYIYIINRIFSFKKAIFFHQIIALKIITIIFGFSVSMIGYNFWIFWLLI